MGMKAVTSSGGDCPNKMDHRKDEGMTAYGTAEKPIAVTDKNLETYVRSEYVHMGRQIGTFTKCWHDTLQGDGRHVDRNVARDDFGKHHVFYFDITEQAKAENAKMKAAWEEMKAEASPEARKEMEEMEKRGEGK
jgi:hypothetical protein